MRSYNTIYCIISIPNTQVQLMNLQVLTRGARIVLRHFAQPSNRRAMRSDTGPVRSDKSFCVAFTSSSSRCAVSSTSASRAVSTATRSRRAKASLSSSVRQA